MDSKRVKFVEEDVGHSEDEEEVPAGRVVVSVALCIDHVASGRVVVDLDRDVILDASVAPNAAARRLLRMTSMEQLNGLLAALRKCLDMPEPTRTS